MPCTLPLPSYAGDWLLNFSTKNNNETSIYAMNLKEKNEYIDRGTETDEFLAMLGKKRKGVHIALGSIEDTKAMLWRGLQHFLGEEARWLDGYDDVARWLADNNCCGLMLYGANGRGKTVLAYDILPVIISYHLKQVKTYKCRAVNLRAVQPSCNEYYAMMRSDVLCVDDFGTEGVANIYGERRDVFSDLVDMAEHDGRILVLSTNLTLKEIRERYGLRTYDRLHAITRAVCLTGESMRKIQETSARK